MANKIITDCRAPDVYPSDARWSYVFSLCADKLPYAEYVCLALNGVSIDGVIGTFQLNRMRAYVRSVIEDQFTLDEFLLNSVFGGDTSEMQKLREKDRGLIKTRKAWVLSMSNQFLAVGL